MKLFLVIIVVFWLLLAISLILISFEDFERDISFRNRTDDNE